MSSGPVLTCEAWRRAKDIDWQPRHTEEPDNRLVTEPSVQPSVEVQEAAWIGGRLSPFDSGVVTSVIPNGFSAACSVHEHATPLLVLHVGGLGISPL